MKYTDVSDFIKTHIRTKQHWNKKVIGMKDAVWQTLTEDTYLRGIAFSAGSRFKVFETTNFGWIVFGPDTKTVDGDIPGRRIFRW
jgi:hypothetical protein